jgi:hypothetical protein
VAIFRWDRWAVEFAAHRTGPQPDPAGAPGSGADRAARFAARPKQPNNTSGVLKKPVAIRRFRPHIHTLID